MYSDAAESIAAELGLRKGKANLEVFAATVEELASKDRDVLAVVSDSRGSGKLGPFGERYPEQLIELGIAEQNLVGVSAGLASAGKKVFAVSPACFLSARSLEQIKNDVAYSDNPVTLVGISAGVSYGALGTTHHSLHDFAVLRAINNIYVVCPADNYEAREAVRAAAALGTPVFLRFGKAALYDLGSEDEQAFEFGKARVLREGSDLAFIATGETVIHALLAAEWLKRSQGLDVRVVDLHSIKPFDTDAVVAAARECDAVITVEEHMINGGLGDACASAILESGLSGCRFKRIAIPDEYTVTGSQADIFRHYGITMEGLVESASRLLAQPAAVS
ncbi:Transketolase, pyridine binding domain protein [Verrucomicrobiia bacterium DG1235]|nr:Transketolase, pyridine binding domain protein [Verrucomicrobiae bacterium DG1235]